MSHSDSHDHSAHGHDEHASHGSLRSYLTGFALAAILTVIPFWLVMGHVFQSHWLTITLVLLLAVVQILVHVVYFLHLDTRSEGGWNMLSFVFTIVLVVIVLGASIWVMYNENANMMPMSPQYQHSE
ncbi:MAG TPA: cytochrome o ubiquinol oxidase subunit IV [Rhodanobacter sp.]